MLNLEEMQALQTALQERYREKWGGLAPEKAIEKLLWLTVEVGEVAQIIKKQGSRAILEDPTARHDFAEELCDVLMYWNDVALCFGLTAQELETVYREKHQRNLTRW